MFESLTGKLTEVLDQLKGKGKLSEEDVKEALKEVKMALLEADVNYKVVKELIGNIEEKAVGKEVMESLTPGQQVIKIVRDELAEIMGEERSDLNLSSDPAVIMVVGLQGSGKTTTCGKLARRLKGDGQGPLLVAADTYRPAAREQLEKLGDDLELPVYADRDQGPEELAASSIDRAESDGSDVVILDTAGRLQIDEEMMDELVRIKGKIDPDEILLVADALTGQEATSIADEFDDRLGVTGIILTKMDGDARGGAALSMVQVSGQPVKFAGVGEKLDDLEPFYPERVAGRILGMGDVLSLVEKAEREMDQDKAAELEEKIKKKKFTLQDFLDQLDEVRNMGTLGEILDKLPGVGNKVDDLDLEGDEIDRIEAIINSMTPEERANPKVIDGSRKRRIARGSGCEVTEVNDLLERFNKVKKMMDNMGSLQKKFGGLPGGLGV
ncbi:MAG: signal recognition particle protein [Candidatus Bipolaricaulota bacterium]|nr:signal recognition particle protein [Candidatus Bipolaricaulota bacterium]MBS3791482.1 signal recognition particle protein [Candidatus Bipolaricaulota bacterium]